MTVELSAAGARFIEAWEGYRDMPYNDSGNNATVAIGHLLHLGPLTDRDRQAGRELAPGVVTGVGGSVSLAHALVLLQHDVDANALQPLRAALKVDLDQAQIDALACLAFNCGPGSLEPGHVVMTAVNSKPVAHDVAELAAWHLRVRVAMLEWAHPAVLERRRLSEAVLFATDKYRTPANPYANS